VPGDSPVSANELVVVVPTATKVIGEPVDRKMS
jgi:hypothetical protein